MAALASEQGPLSTLGKPETAASIGGRGAVAADIEKRCDAALEPQPESV